MSKKIHLFSQLELRSLHLKNRIVVSPMCQYKAVEGHIQDWHIAHHSRFALGGMALSFVEATGITPEGRITHGCTGIWHDNHVLGLKKIELEELAPTFYVTPHSGQFILGSHSRSY